MQWSPPTVLCPKSLGLPIPINVGYFFMLFESVTDLWMSALEVTKDLEFETFYTKNILLNEGIRAWMVAQD